MIDSFGEDSFYGFLARQRGRVFRDEDLNLLADGIRQLIRALAVVDGVAVEAWVQGPAELQIRPPRLFFCLGFGFHQVDLEPSVSS